jgi:cytochrome c oxidase assembly protein subunit 11
MADAPQNRNRNTVLWCAGAALAMLGASFAAIPLYQEFCQATGFGGTTRRSEAAPGAVAGPTFTVRFDANVAPGLPWVFVPEQRSVTLKPGEQKIAFYRANNTSNAATAGQAVFNVQPDLAGKYFFKIACFCFTEQHLAAGQMADMPVTFYVDPKILNDPDLASVRNITLSYTFYPAADQKAESSNETGAAAGRSAVRVGLGSELSPRATN